jgi:hypothetical protein
MPLRTSIASYLSTLCLSCAAPLSAVPAHLERGEVIDLYARFSAAANERDFAAMPELFAEDARWQASAGALGFRHQGRAAIRDWLVGNQGKVRVLFYLAAPPRVELLTPELARAQTSINELLQLTPSGEVKQLFGVYHDELRKKDGRWLFSARRFELRRELVVSPGAPDPADSRSR